MELKIEMKLDDDERQMMHALDAWWEAMYASNGVSSVNGYERWAHMDEDCAYGIARKYFKELLYDLFSSDVADRLDEECGMTCEKPSVALKGNEKYIFTGERY